MKSVKKCDIWRKHEMKDEGVACSKINNKRKVGNGENR